MADQRILPSKISTVLFVSNDRKLKIKNLAEYNMSSTDLQRYKENIIYQCLHGN